MKNIHCFDTNIDLTQKALGQSFEFDQELTTHIGLSNQGLLATLAIDLDPGKQASKQEGERARDNFEDTFSLRHFH